MPEPTPKHTPNRIPVEHRIGYLAGSLALFVYCTYGLWHNDIYFPGKYTRGAHFHGISAWILYAAMLCGVLNMFSVVVDHYDRRNNERNYRLFARGTFILGAVLLFGAIIFELAFQQPPTH